MDRRRGAGPHTPASLPAAPAGGGRGEIHLVAAARPNLPKLAALWHALRARPELPRPVLVHTGQHDAAAMFHDHLADLGLPAPEVSLGVSGGGHAALTGRTLMACGALWEARRPLLAVVPGDVDGALAAGLAARQLGLPLAHLEAGLRCGDRDMPEEINRRALDAVADLLWAPDEASAERLRREGHDGAAVRAVGNAMADSLLRALPAARARPLPEGLRPDGNRDGDRNAGRRGDREGGQGNGRNGGGGPGGARGDGRWAGTRGGGRAGDDRGGHAAPGGGGRGVGGCGAAPPGGYGVVTLHRPANVDDPVALAAILAALGEAAAILPMAWPLHPRSAARIAAAGLALPPGVRALPPLGYADFLGLLARARLVATDSGGVQEEATLLDLPCLTLRPSTERPVTLLSGSNRLVPAGRLPAAVAAVLAGRWPRARPIPLWDGRAGERMADHLAEWLPATAGGRVPVPSGFAAG